MNSIACIQFTDAPGEARRNRARILDFLAAAAARGPKIIIAPELAISGYMVERTKLELFEESWDGPTFDATAAARFNVVIAGGFCERDEGELYNSALLLGPTGLYFFITSFTCLIIEKFAFPHGDRRLNIFNMPIGKRKIQ